VRLPPIRRVPVCLGRVGGSVPPQTFLTNLSQRAEEVGQEQQLHSTTHPKNKVKIKVKIKTVGETRHWPEVPATFKSWPEYEDKAASLRDWSPSIVTGLLQPEGYARALISVQPHITQETASARLANRMQRQQRDNAPAAWFIIDELSLYREVGSAQTMASQLRHLLEVAAMPKVTIQVLPAVAHPVNASGFLMADDAVWIEHAAGGFVYTEEELVSGIALRFDSLRAESYGASESLALIERLEGRWKAGASPLTRTAMAGTA
jgi:hypothetical protein